MMKATEFKVGDRVRILNAVTEYDLIVLPDNPHIYVTEAEKI